VVSSLLSKIKVAVVIILSKVMVVAVTSLLSKIKVAVIIHKTSEEEVVTILTTFRLINLHDLLKGLVSLMEVHLLSSNSNSNSTGTSHQVKLHSLTMVVL